MSIVSDTGPLIALAKVDLLSVLEQLFKQVRIPPAVHRELLAKSGPEATRLDRALAGFIEVTPTPSFPPEVQVATSRLDPGEQQAVALAYEQKALLLIDDRLGRSAAQRLNLAVTGVVGVLIRAKEANLLPAVLPVLRGMRQQNYWLSDELLETAAKLAGESEDPTR